jgi:hypothetical protein
LILARVSEDKSQQPQYQPHHEQADRKEHTGAPVVDDAYPQNDAICPRVNSSSASIVLSMAL